MSTRPDIELAEELGAGSTGAVVRGVLRRAFGEWPAGQEVAVKVLHPELAEERAAVEAFREEARIGARVRHPGLAHVLHWGPSERGFELVMPFVPGRTLGEILEREGPLPEPRLRAALAQVAGGLAALHEAGWLHGDVKPDNMRLDEGGRAVLLDLGFARPVRRVEGAQRGSLAWLAPEQARGEPARPASDVFSLGIVLFELATGTHPFAGAGAGGRPHRAAGFSSSQPLRRSLEVPEADRLLAALAAGRFVPPSRLVPQLSPFLDHLAQEMLMRDPQRRPSSGAVAERLERGERSEWWRALVDFDVESRRGGPSEPHASHLTPLVGREREMKELARALAEAMGPAGGPAGAVSARGEVAPRGLVVWLEGPRASGKSRLLSDFAARARARDEPPLYLYGRCPAIDEIRPCHPILRLLQRWLRVPFAAATGERQRELLEQLVPPAEAETLIRAVDPAFAGATPVAVPSALAVWLLRLGARQPLIVFLDDLNYADEGSLSVLIRVAEGIGGTRALLVLGVRQDEEVRRAQQLDRVRELSGRWPGTRSLGLGPLEPEAVEDLAALMFHPSMPRQRIGRVLWSRSRGSPGLLSEILRTLRDRGQLRAHGPDDARLHLLVPPERLPLPASLHTLIADRYRALPQEDRRWLERLAVAGGRIAPGFLTRAFPPTPRSEIEAVLGRLTTSGWLTPAGPRYRFARPALREAVYRSIRPSRRVRLHAAAARTLSAEPGRGLGAGDAFQRAFHLRAAGEHEALLRILRPLISALFRRGQPQRVHTLAAWGLESIEALPARPGRDRLRIELLEAAADAADRLGYREDQRRWLDRLSDLELDPEREGESLCRVYLLHGRHAVSIGRYGLGRGMLRNAVELAESAGVPLELQSETLRRLAAVQAHVGELREAASLARRALECAAHHPQRAVSRLMLGQIDLLEARIEPCLRQVDRALSLVRRAADWSLPGVLAAGHMLRGRAFRVGGRPRRALGSMRRALRLARRAGERRLELEAGARLGGLMLDLDRAEEAESRLRDALLVAAEIEDRRGRALAGLWLGILLWERGDPEAARLLGRTAELAREIGLDRVEAVTLAIQARIALLGGELPRALQAIERAAHLLELRGAELPDRVAIAGTRALVLESAGRSGEAAELRAGLRRRLRRENQRIRGLIPQQRHRLAATRLLESVLSAEGLVYPRVRGYERPGE